MHQGWIHSDFIVKSRKKDSTNICGYASVFDIADEHNHIITKGAFKNAKSSDIKLLWQHDPASPIGIIEKTEEDEYGLLTYATITHKTQQGREASALARQSVVTGLSIGFTIKSSDYNSKGQQVINEIKLYEISLVTFAANPDAKIRHVKKKSNYSELASEQHMIDELSNLVKQIENY